MHSRRGGLLIAVLMLTNSVQAQTTVFWTGNGDGVSFQDPSNWSPAPGGQISYDPGTGPVNILNQGSLTNSFVVDDDFASIVLIDPALPDEAAVASGGLTLDSTAAGVTELSLEFRKAAFVDMNTDGAEAFGGYAGDGNPATVETMIVDGPAVEVYGHFVSLGLQVELNEGLLTLRGVGNPIASGATINFGGSHAGTLNSFESPENFVTEHLSKIYVDGFRALQGANIEIVSDGGSGTLVTVLESPIRPGDFTGDGQVTAADWVSFKSNLFTIFSPATLRDGYLLGDLDADGDNDEFDFVTFKSLYEEANGVGSFAAITAIPEPASWALAAVGAAALLRRRGKNESASRAPRLAARSSAVSRIGMMAALAVVLVAVAATSAPAVTVAIENFDYGTGPISLEGLGGGSGWIGTWGAPVGDATPPTGFFQVIDDAAVYNGNAGGQLVITQERTLETSVLASTSDEITIDFDLTIGATDSQIGRGIGLNFVRDGSIAFTLGKRLNGNIGIWSAGIGGASVQLGGSLIPSGTVGVHSLKAALSYNGTDSFITLTDGANVVSAILAGQVGFNAVQLTGYHQSTTSNGIDDLSIDVSPLSSTRVTLEVDPLGNATLVNLTSAPVSIDLYKVVSPQASLNVNYDGLADSPIPAAGFPSGNGDGTGWEKAGGNNGGLLGEAFLTGSSELAVNQRVPLGQMFSTINSAEPIEFTYRDAGSGAFVAGFVNFVTSNAPGDFDGNGVVNDDDLALWSAEFGSTLDGEDFLVWQRNFTGAPSPAAAAAIPEPAAFALALLAVAGTGLCRRVS